MIHKCDCCGHTRDFVDGGEAFNEGWDAPPHFHGYVACNLCPAATQFMEGGWSRHAPIHEQWEKNGRPDEFSQDTCVLEEDRVDPAKIEALKEALAGLEDAPIAEKLQALQRLKEEGKL